MYNISDELNSFKNNLTNMYVIFNNLNNESSKNNRISENIEDIRNQFINDKVMFNSLRTNALEIFDRCNQLLMQYELNNT